MVSTSQYNAFCFDYSAKHLIAFSDELAKPECTRGGGIEN